MVPSCSSKECSAANASVPVLCLSELLLRRPWFPGVSDIDQLKKVFAALGVPNKENWPEVDKLPSYYPMKGSPPPPLDTLFPPAQVRASMCAWCQPTRACDLLAVCCLD